MADRQFFFAQVGQLAPVAQRAGKKRDVWPASPDRWPRPRRPKYNSRDRPHVAIGHGQLAEQFDQRVERPAGRNRGHGDDVVAVEERPRLKRPELQAIARQADLRTGRDVQPELVIGKLRAASSLKVANGRKSGNIAAGQLGCVPLRSPAAEFRATPIRPVRAFRSRPDANRRSIYSISAVRMGVGHFGHGPRAAEPGDNKIAYATRASSPAAGSRRFSAIQNSDPAGTPGRSSSPPVELNSSGVILRASTSK